MRAAYLHAVLSQIFFYCSKVSNTIVQKSSAVDPDRTPQMVEDEQFLNSECMDLIWSLGRDTDSERLATLTQNLEGSIKSYRSQAIAYIRTSSGSPNTQIVHAYRRKIAVLHEFLDLHRQGHDAFALASAWGETVYSGRRYVTRYSPLILPLTVPSA